MGYSSVVAALIIMVVLIVIFGMTRTGRDFISGKREVKRRQRKRRNSRTTELLSQTESSAGPEDGTVDV